MVGKLVGAVVRSTEGRLVQLGIKCGGCEYLRIIYGPKCTRPDTLTASASGSTTTSTRSRSVRTRLA